MQIIWLKMNVYVYVHLCATGVMNSLFSVYGKKQKAFSLLFHARIIHELLSSE
jgi:5-methylcytosine-specific restriction endonuclease McrBC regulatory subunit McrC